MYYLKQTLWLIAELILFLIIAVLSGLLLALVTYPLYNNFDLFGWVSNTPEMDDPIGLLVTSILPILVLTLIAIFAIHKIFKREWSVLGMGLKGSLKQYGVGSLGGFILIVVGFLSLWVMQQINVVGSNVNIGLMIGFMVFFVVQSFAEELLCRSYLIPAIDKRLGTWVALILSSIIFALMHMGNSGIGIVGVLNLLMAGIIMGLCFIQFKNVWVPAGLHFTWNYFQGTILGFEVSGHEMYNMLTIQDVGLPLLTGGDFGFEGSLMSLILLVAGIGWLFWQYPDLGSRLTWPSRSVVGKEESATVEIP